MLSFDWELDALSLESVTNRVALGQHGTVYSRNSDVATARADLALKATGSINGFAHQDSHVAIACRSVREYAFSGLEVRP